MELAAVLVAPEGVSGTLRGLCDRLMQAGVMVTVVDELATAADQSAQHESPPAILLDLMRESPGEIEDQRAAIDAVRRALEHLPRSLPVIVVGEADPVLLLAAFRAGAGDVIDVGLEGTAGAKGVVQRICERQAARLAETRAFAEQRAMIEDLLKDLIRTERRSIDAEERLAMRARTSGEHALPEDSRGPAVLLVEHERAVADQLADLLEERGVSTFAYVTGEEALREAAQLSGSTGLDLALIAAQLPGIDGLETTRRLRERIPGLPAFLMTAVHDADLAERAADLGVVGFVHKPLADIEDVVGRLAQLARESLGRTREHVYLARIKERHERVLARYRSLPREP
ncbi:MAG TPA: response regulator [Kofleriaceae bacterium]|jgi:CheY-like chemotaxis protein